MVESAIRSEQGLVPKPNRSSSCTVDPNRGPHHSGVKMALSVLLSRRKLSHVYILFSCGDEPPKGRNSSSHLPRYFQMKKGLVKFVEGWRHIY